MPTRQLSDACSHLQEAVPLLIDKFNSRYGKWGLYAAVGEVLRTTAEQQNKYAQGRTAPGKIITNADGTNNLSDHQAQTIHGETCSHAVDINVFREDKTYVADERYYHALLGLSICVGLLSGGDWVHPDWPHLACPYTTEK